MANTTNLNLAKPLGTDHALVSVLNGNMDVIDSAIGALPSGSNLQGEIDTLNSNLGKYSSTRVFSSDYDNLMDFLNDCDTILDNLPSGLSLVPVGHMYASVSQSVGLAHGGAVFAVNRNSSSRTLYVLNILTGNIAFSYITKASGTWETNWSRVARTQNT